MDAIALAARPLGLPADWRQVRPGKPSGRRTDGRTACPCGGAALLPVCPEGLRLSQSASRRGGRGRAVLDLLDRLDPTDSLGHRVLGSVLARAGRDVDYDDEAAPPRRSPPMNTAEAPRTPTRWSPDEPPSVDWFRSRARLYELREPQLAGVGQVPAQLRLRVRPLRQAHRPFFRWNPALANKYLEHPYFEVRAVASRSADVFRLVGLMYDPTKPCAHVALRLPQRSGRVARRSGPGSAHPGGPAHRRRPAGGMVDDPDYFVRKLVAQRLPLPLLPRMARDPDQEVRLVVVERLPVPALLDFRDDPEVDVRRAVARRLPAGLLGEMASTRPGRCVGKWPSAPAGCLPAACSSTKKPRSARRLQARLETLDSEARHG